MVTMIKEDEECKREPGVERELKMAEKRRR